MKAILEFVLPDEKGDFEMCNQASDMNHILWEMDQWLRTNIKYAPETDHEERTKAFIEAREKLSELLKECSINLY